MATTRHIIEISFAIGFSAALSGCMSAKEMFDFRARKQQESAMADTAQPGAPADAAASTPPIAVAALDPLNAPVPGSAAAATPAPPSSDAMLLPAPSTDAAHSQTSQRVPLGSLSTSAPSQPVPLAPPPAKTPVMASETHTPATAPAVRAPVTQQPTAAVIVPQPVVAEKAPPLVTSKPAQMTTQVMVVPQAKVSKDEEETVVINSTTAAKAPLQARGFVPASVMPDPPRPAALGPGDMSLTTGQRNIVQRFQTLRRLQEEALITEEEFNRRRNANIGALLPYTRDPAGIGLERSVPGADAISARLTALRRAFEMRAITAQQHALERTMILNALLPEIPDERSNRQPPPRDVIEGASMVGYLEALRTDRLITSNEFDAEKVAIDQVLRTGLLPSQAIGRNGGEGSKKAAEAQTASVKPAAVVEADPMTTEITGPVVHLASFSSEASAKRGWDEVMSHNKAILTGVKPIIRKVDLGEKGIFFRLMAGSYTSMSAAETACIQLKQNNQFCRASADGG